MRSTGWRPAIVPGGPSMSGSPRLVLPDQPRTGQRPPRACLAVDIDPSHRDPARRAAVRGHQKERGSVAPLSHRPPRRRRPRSRPEQRSPGRPGPARDRRSGARGDHRPRRPTTGCPGHTRSDRRPATSGRWPRGGSWRAGEDAETSGRSRQVFPTRSARTMSAWPELADLLGLLRVQQLHPPGRHASATSCARSTREVLTARHGCRRRRRRRRRTRRGRRRFDLQGRRRTRSSIRPATRRGGRSLCPGFRHEECQVCSVGTDDVEHPARRPRDSGSRRRQGACRRATTRPDAPDVMSSTTGWRLAPSASMSCSRPRPSCCETTSRVPSGDQTG